ncbi:TetR/AcrR family transcriptional regulator [Hymenobacter sp. YC55]|uniref:TetR/AcrR family transcriptional regulator n=1 Tax=Hymenobacter sp. YC55 TaxID=3034019 RepID=UPI0023F7A73D|nr:TetR/AcrR family transcriptional regulator [Hymenobacter sp. YC55]MDF7815049.1 TetR/AcrR family transcriptional regulator [Hymenobacter sp. YC55]
MSKAERTKQRIIEQAAPLFNQKGIAGTTIDDVLQAADVAKGCLYSHFESKEDLSRQTADFLLDKITCRIQLAMSQATTAKGRIFAYLDFCKNPLDTAITGGCPIFNLAVEADDNNPAVKQKVGAKLLAAQAMFSNILQEGITNGEFASTLNAADFAFKMFSAIEGAIVICRILNTSLPIQQLIKSLKAELEAHVPS